MASELQKQAQKLLDESKEIRGIEGYISAMGYSGVDGPRTKNG